MKPRGGERKKQAGRTRFLADSGFSRPGQTFSVFYEEGASARSGILSMWSKSAISDLQVFPEFRYTLAERCSPSWRKRNLGNWYIIFRIRRQTIAQARYCRLQQEYWIRSKEHEGDYRLHRISLGPRDDSIALSKVNEFPAYRKCFSSFGRYTIHR